MIKLKYKHTCVALLLLLSLPLFSFHGPSNWFKEEVSKEITKSFNVDHDVYLGVQNKYGSIEISTWDKNEVDVKVDIKVSSNSRSNAQEFLDGIEILFSESSGRLGMKSYYPETDSSPWWSSWWSSSKSISFEINYEIRAPEGISTELINKYGQVSLEKIEGSCDVVNKYGDILLDEIGKDLTLDLGYGKAKIGNVYGDSDMTIKYSSIKINECQNLRLESKYSDYKIGKSGKLDIESKYDDYVIEEAISMTNEGKYDDFRFGSLGGVDIETKYTDLIIDNLDKVLVFDGGYGSIKVKQANNLKKVDVDAKYTNVQIHYNGAFDLDFDGDKTDLKIEKLVFYTHLTFPPTPKF